MDPGRSSWIVALERHQELLPEAALILLLGVSGVGKTSFISKAIEEDLQIGQTLESATSEIFLYPFKRMGRDIILFDTPGFDDTYKADIDILGDIVQLLRSINDHKGRISGIIYLHRITDNRVSGSTKKNFHMLWKLCGERFLRHVVLVTTMWGQLDSFEGDQRQDQLENSFWKDMIEGKAMALKYMDNTNSALDIIDALLRCPLSPDTVPDIQRESLEEKRSLLETSAGRVIYEDIKQKLQQYDRSIAKIEEEDMELEQEMNSGSVYTGREKEEEVQESKRELKRAKDRLVDQREQLEGLLKSGATKGSSTPFATRGDRSLGEEKETISETRSTPRTSESVLQRRSKSGRPRNAPNRKDTCRPESIEPTSLTKSGLQLPWKQSHDVSRKESFPEGGMVFPQMMDYGGNAEGLIGPGGRAFERERVNDTMSGIGEIGSQEENNSNHTYYEPTPLHRGVYSGDEAAVRLEVGKGADVKTKTENGMTALHQACWNGHEKMVQSLLREGADVNARTVSGETALHQAAENGHEAIARLLVDHDADVNAKTVSGETALHQACRNGHEKMVRLLVKRGVDVNTRTVSSETALHQAAENGHDAIARLLVDHGVDVNARADHGMTALHQACWNGHEKMVRLLIKKGADVNESTLSGETALHQAAENGHDAVVRLLLEKGANINARTDDGETVLYSAVESKHDAVASLLMERGADVNPETISRQTALHWAVENGQVEVVQQLLGIGADVNAKTDKRVTALHLASLHGHEKMVRLLVERGADINAKTVSGQTALHWAVENRQVEVVQQLLETGADINAKTDNGMTALHQASLNGHDAVARLLVERGADINA